MKKKRKDSGRGKRKHRTAPPYPTELKVRIAWLLLEEATVFRVKD